MTPFYTISLGLLLQALGSVLEACIVGQTGAENLALLGLSGSLLNTLYAFPFGLAIGVQTAVAGRAGCEADSLILRRSLLYGISLGLALAIGVISVSFFLAARL